MVDANQQYRVPHWGEGYFRVNSNGEFVIQPDAGEQKPGIVLANVIRAAGERNLNLPLLVRFNDILRHRVASLERAFSNALSACEYAADYHPIYPVKVNQQRSVVETIAGCAGAGFECGSKPELMVVLAASAAGGIIVCNGYKDRDYIRLGVRGIQQCAFSLRVCRGLPPELSGQGQPATQCGRDDRGLCRRRI